MMSGGGATYEREAVGFAIVRMTEHDLLDVVEIEESSGLSLWGWDAYRAELDRRESVMLVAVESVRSGATERRVEGFVAARLNADELHINNIGVREANRKRGLGSSLLASALEWGAARGAVAAVLEVRAGNIAAQKLYGKAGFEVVGRRRGYYKNPFEDALIMTRPLVEES